MKDQQEPELLIEIKFLVPIREDKTIGNGELHPHTRWEKLNKDLVEFGGFYTGRDLYDGDSKEYGGDISRVYYASVPPSKSKEFETFLKKGVKLLFRQQCIYLVYTGKTKLI